MMNRTLYLILATPLLILLFILPDFSGGWSEHVRFAVQVGGAILLWLLVFSRLIKTGARKELSVFPSLPFLFYPFYYVWGAGGPPSPFALLMLGAAFIAGCVVMIMSFVPDEWGKGTRRLDGISIMLAVFTAYFVLTECVSLVGVALR